MKKLLFALAGIWLMSFSSQRAVSFSLGTPPASVKLLGEGFISTSINERDLALSPDGKEIFFTISTPRSTFQTIVFSRMIKPGQWTELEIAPFAGEFSDLEPAYSADGNTLYFASNRPLEGNSPKDFDVWKVTRMGNTWGTPENLGSIINTEADEFYPSIAKNGNLYFTAAYAGGVGKEDIYMSKFTSSGYQKAEPLDTAVNSKLYEFNAFVAPDESYILFTSYGRKDDKGGGDLYISTKDTKGKWQPAKHLQELNSRQIDYCPSISPDGKSLFFTSERHELPASFTSGKATYKQMLDIAKGPANSTGNIYWIDFQQVLNAYK